MQNQRFCQSHHQQNSQRGYSQQHLNDSNSCTQCKQIRKSSMATNYENSQINSSIEKIVSCGEMNQEVLKELQKSLSYFLILFKTNVQKINGILELSITQLQEKIQTFQQTITLFKGQDSLMINKEKIKLITFYEAMKTQLKQELLQLMDGINMDDLIKQIERIQLTNKNDKNNQVQFNNFSVKNLINEINFPEATFNKRENDFKYQLLEKITHKQQKYCYSVAFNKDASLLAVGCEECIKIFEFNKRELKEVFKLNGHNKYVRCLYFLKNTNNFISGGEDKMIIIWKQDEQKKWNIYKTLANHLKWISCLIMNPNEDLLISGSGDRTIKFWNKKSDWNCSQTILINTDIVSCLSMNQSGNKLIACEWNGMILVIEYQNEWTIIQTINVYKEKGFRLCFIDDDLFAFQPYCSKYLHIYEFDKISLKFQKSRDVQVPEAENDCSSFPQQFIQSKQILVSKHGKYLNILKIDDNRQFKTIQSLDIGYIHFFGATSENGEFLAIWVDSLKEIQIYQNQESY